MKRENRRRRGSPFDTYDYDFNSGLDQPIKPFTATTGTDKQVVARRQAASGVEPTSVAFPTNLYIPTTGQSIDIANLITVAAGTTEEVLRFTAPSGNATQFIGYVIYTNSLDFSSIQFNPTVNGNRIFPFHGNPLDNFKIALAVTGDLGRNGIRDAQLSMQPGDVLRWTVQNTSAAPFAAGVRMIGYADATIIRNSGRVGG